MRVITYAAGWPPENHPNGIVTSLGVLAPALRAQGCALRILAGDGEGTAGDNDVYFIDDIVGAATRRTWLDRTRGRLPAFHPAFTTWPARIARAVLQSPDLRAADIFEIEESFGWSDVMQRRLPMPVVVGLRGPWFMNGAALKGAAADAFDRVRIAREGRAIAAADGVSARAKAVLDEVRGYYGLALDNAVVIPNAVNPAKNDFVWRREAADPNEILFIGRFDRHKGADIVLRAFSLLAAQRPSLKLTFVGPDDQTVSDGGRTYSRADYVKAIMPPDCAARVTFTGFVPSSGLPPFRARAFATIIASRVEIFPNVLLEALSHGSPVVATRVGGVPEIARSEEDALLTEPEDAEGLARALGSLLDAPERAAALGASGRRRVETEFSPRRVAGLTMDHYREVIARSAKAAKRQR